MITVVKLKISNRRYAVRGVSILWVMLWTLLIVHSASFALSNNHNLSFKSILNRQPDSPTLSSPAFLSHLQYRESHNNSLGVYAGALALGVGLFKLDESVESISQQRSLHIEDNSELFGEIEPLGRNNIWFASVPLFLSHALLFRDNKSLMVAGELFVGFQVMSGFTYVTKTAFGRKRPFESDSPFQFFQGGNAFISGHTVHAFTFATIISKNYPRQNLSFLGIDRELPLVPILCYSTAGLVGLQRLYSNAHWSSDVYFGALAGYAVGSLMVKLGDWAGQRWLSIVPGDPPRVSLSFNIN